ncbi:MAG: hypothetical protein M3O32_03790, partial [Actinomycetota bacterium]|nr:hypothetical protein [Actinomycetota bacterium]
LGPAALSAGDEFEPGVHHHIPRDIPCDVRHGVPHGVFGHRERRLTKLRRVVPGAGSLAFSNHSG